MSLALRKKQPFEGTDRAKKRRVHASLFAVSQRDFQKHVRFRDSQGYTYALPLGTDPLYKQYVDNGTVDSDRQELDDANEVPLDGDRVMLYLRKPRTQRLVPMPKGEIELLDLSTQKLYSATVSMVIVSQMNKPGHIIIESLVDTGRRAKKTDFTGKHRSDTD